MAALAFLGYAYIGLILLLLLALLGGLVGGAVWAVRSAGTVSVSMIGAGKALVPVVLGLLSLIGLIFRSLQVHFEAPQGVILDRETAPRLFSMLDGVCAAL